jgi:hypothetical protein
MRNKGVKRIMALVVILFFIPFAALYSQCKSDFFVENSFTTQGISNGMDHYYQNLIVQDVALASQSAFGDISLRFDYRVHYTLDQCKPGSLEIKVYSPGIKGSPLNYLGYDISSSIRPEKADIVFHMLMPGGFITDSLVFYNIPVATDDGLYTSMSYTASDTSSRVTATFARAVFYYTKSSYEKFRDHLLQIDEYYAASLLADSTVSWTTGGFLSEHGSRPAMIMRQLEIERITRYINPGQFNLVLSPNTGDRAGLAESYQELLRLNNRYKAIVKYNHNIPEALNSKPSGIAELTGIYFDWLEYYYQLAYHSDFRYVNFIEGLASPELTNSSLAGIFRTLHSDYNMPVYKSEFLQGIMVNGFISRGKQYEAGGDQLRAYKYYKSAERLSFLLHLKKLNIKALDDKNRMRDSIAVSYMAISRKSAQTGNPGLAAQYFLKAKDLFGTNGQPSVSPPWLTEFETWLYHDFEIQADRLLELKNYDKALVYLGEIEFHCLSTPSYACPELFNEWMRIARQGIYLGLLKKAMISFSQDEYSEAWQKYRDAVALRLGAGYRVEKDVSESELERNFRQISYDEMVEEGMKFYRNGEYISALYFFNKAEYLQKPGLNRPYADLAGSRQESARQVILQNLSEGRVKVWAHDFAGADNVLLNIEKMLLMYQFGREDSLNLQYVALKGDVLRAECEKVAEEYQALMLMSSEAEGSHDFVKANDYAVEAANLSIDNLKCGINDEQAWYRKFNLETPAEFQRMDKQLEARKTGDCTDFLDRYQALRNYYQKYRLIEFGIAFTPLFDRVSAASDSSFLSCMFHHYIHQRDYDHALDLLKVMKELGLAARPLAPEQKELAGYLARRDLAKASGIEPWNLLAGYSTKDKWYRQFNCGYRKSWLKASKWKMSYWPLIWEK